MWRKLQIAMACLGTVVAGAILLGVLIVLLGMEESFGLYWSIYFVVGPISIFIFFWPFYSKRLK